MSLPNTAVARPTCVLNAHLSATQMTTNEPHLLGLDAVHLLAGQQSCFREKSCIHLLANGATKGHTHHQRGYFRRGFGRRIPEDPFVKGRRRSHSLVERSIRGNTVHSRNCRRLCPNPWEREYSFAGCHPSGLRRLCRYRLVFNQRPEVSRQGDPRNPIHRRPRFEHPLTQFSAPALPPILPSPRATPNRE